MFKKQISEIQPNGKKKILEKSWFTRGTKLMITGYRRDDQFVAKTYKSTQAHQLYIIDKVEGDRIVIRHERYTSQDAIEEDYEE
jgi:DNA polymerase-3 subunit alpha